MPYRFATWALAACLLSLPALAQESGRRPAPPLLVVTGAEIPVRLARASVEVDIGGGSADTTIELAFRNPNGRALEGELQFPLAPGQRVVGFALDIDGEMRPAVPVEKARGRQVFEDIARRGVDPGLLENTQGDNFKLRIYPLMPGGERRVRLRLAQPLGRAPGLWSYRLPLAWAAGAADWRAAVRVHGATSAPALAGAVDAPAFRRQDDGYAAELPRSALAGGVLALQGRTDAAPRAWTGEFADASYAVAEIPLDAAARPRALPRVVGLLWDSSGSGGARRHDLEFALLDRYFRATGDVEVRLLRLRDRADKPQGWQVRGGDWSALRRELEATDYDGATALGGWTPERRVGEYLLFSDGLENYGSGSFPELARGQRLYAVNAAAGGADGARLAALAGRHGGRALDLGDGAPGALDAAAQALLGDGLRIVALDGDGLADLQAESLDVRGGVVRVAGRRLARDALLRVGLSDGRTIELPVTPASPRLPLAPLLWAGWRIDALQADHALKRAGIARLARRFGIATRDTSLIVLERAEDYVRYDISPPPSLRKAVDDMQRVQGRERADAGARRLESVVRALRDKEAWWKARYPSEGADRPGPGRDLLKGNPAYWPLDLPAPPPPPAPPPSPVSSFAPAPAAPTGILARSAPMPLDAVRRSLAPDARPEATAPIGIALRKWTPDQRYLDRMAHADGAQAYAIYLDRKPDHAASSAFYLDVADTLFEKGARDLALRVLSNLAEMDLENRQVLRVLGYRLMQAGAPELALPVFEQVLRIAEDEPQSWRDLGLAHAAAGHPQQAVDLLVQVALRDWNGRFSEIELIALADMNALVAANRGKVDTGRIDPRLLRHMPLDLRVLLSWDSDDSDMDLWVTGPDGERCYYGNRFTRLGGRLSRDATGGYGPEEFSLRHARPGKYRIEANFFGRRQQIVAGATTLQLKLVTGFGTPGARERMVTLRLGGRGDTILVGEFEVPAGR